MHETHNENKSGMKNFRRGYINNRLELEGSEQDEDVKEVTTVNIYSAKFSTVLRDYKRHPANNNSMSRARWQNWL